MQKASLSQPDSIVRLMRHSLDLAYSEACALRGMFQNLPANETTNEMFFHLERLAAQLVELADLTGAFQAPVRSELLRTVREERSRLFAAVARVPSDHLTTALPGGWSVKDIVAHVVDRELRAIERLELIAQGREDEAARTEPVEADADHPHTGAIHQDSSWEAIARQSDEAGDRLLGAIAALSEAQVTGGTPPVSAWLPTWTFAHYRKHLADVEWALSTTGK